MLEGLYSTKHHIKDDTSTPNIDFVCVRLACEHLWCTKLDNASVGLHDLSLRVMLPCHVEVNDEDLVVTISHKQIGRFYVSMHDLIFV